MATFTVDVAVSDFFVAGITNVDHLDLEGQTLAGQRLTFQVKVVNVRDASDEEIAHRHIHGEGGHHH